MISQSAEYALRAALLLAEHSPVQGPVRADEVADQLRVPRNYLSKILHELTQHGLLKSTRGPRGGFRLARPPEGITLESIVEVFDPDLLAEEHKCLLGRPECSDENRCAAHDHWKEVSSAVRRFFRTTSLHDLASSRDPVSPTGGVPIPAGERPA
ncbi:MAG: RrF2 family transcriptional regulator [bacterium]